MLGRHELTDNADFNDGFYLGFQSARFALLRHGWTSDSVTSVAEALKVLDAERDEIIRIHDATGSLR